jgi:EAL domain-containing protein (putative c-di-GMP-specific phosphodiesterase class I)/CheY-like chemotaxis protein/GGDEF domain-containing protein
MNAYNNVSRFPSPGATRRVIVLDDDPLVTRTLERGINKAGFTTETANHHTAFFELLSRGTPDIVVLDLMMPGMDGVQVIAEMAEKGYTCSLIIISGIDRQTIESAQKTAQMRGFNVLGVLGKPFRRHHLARLLERYAANDATTTVASAEAFNPSHTSPSTLPSAAQLEAAITNGEIHIVLQPKVYCRTGTLAGFEALARWQHDGEAVAPDQFIRLAEDEGLIDKLTWVVFEQALSAMDALRSPLVPLVNVSDLSLAINISVLSLTKEALFERMVELCSARGIPPGRIIFELTESAAMRDPVRSIETLTRLRLKGFKLSIDDFGTGYSSMAQLVRLPFSEIKVDKSFVLNALSTTEDEAVVRSIVQLGANLGMKSTAEGIESEQTLNYLRSIGCDLAQGFGIGRPMPASDIPSWLEQREKARETNRLAVLKHSDLMASAGERRFERLTALARRFFRMPVGLVTLLDDEQQLIKAGAGYAGTTMPRGASICHHTLRGDDTMVIEDSRVHPALASNDVLHEAGFVFYAGHPICFEAGEKAGAICVIDQEPRQFNEQDRIKLAAFAKVAEEELKRGEDCRSDVSGLLTGQTFMPQAKGLLWLSGQLGVRAFVVLVSLEAIGKLELRFGHTVAESMVSTIATAFTEVFSEGDLTGHPRKDEIAAIVMATDGRNVRHRLEQFANALRKDSKLAEALPSVGMYTAIREVKPAKNLSLSVLFEETRSGLTPVYWPEPDHVA